MKSIYTKEIQTYLNSLIAYIVIIVFLTFTGLFTWVFPDTSILYHSYAEMGVLFDFAPLAFLLLIPALTMRSFSEEKKDGTIELLISKPITDLQIILGKYFAALTLVFLALLPTLVYYYTIYQLGNPKGNLDSAAVFSSYIGLMLLAAVYTSIGIFASSITSNQLLSFLFAIVLCYFLYDGIGRISTLDFSNAISGMLDYLSLNYHFIALSKGVVDTRNVFYFITVIFLALFGTKLILGSRNWD